MNETISSLSLLYTALAPASVNFPATGFDFSLTTYSRWAECGLSDVIDTIDSLKLRGTIIPAAYLPSCTPCLSSDELTNCQSKSVLFFNDFTKSSPALIV